MKHDIIIGIHYNSRLLWVCCVLEQAIVRWSKPITVLWYLTLVYSSQKKRCSSPALCHPFHPPWDVTQNIATHHEFQGADNFAVTAVLWRHTWRRALHTCCTLASVMRARLSVFWCKSADASTCIHTNRAWRQLCSWVSTLLSLWQVKWGRKGSKERGERVEVCEHVWVWVCVCLRVCVCM